ncbi:alpha/beta fold hydrolase [Lederbergia citri]|uniref:alpha/beta fold hydrolase n=1 Tax=Lederbergia citri TaxID=2833580 RepID=UPI001F263F71|nr:alpha/beta hydrolase [Lederbergia citri]
MSQTNILKEIVLRKRNQRKNAKELQITTANSIVEGGYVKIGGIDQWITIRGENRNHPVLLLIHGGPASTYSIFSPLLRSWEKHFIVVQWDQRGAGTTFGKNGKDGSGAITFERLAKDGIEVAEYLRGKLGHQKIILIGSSAGSLIGIMMAKLRPDLFYAYVGTDQNSPDSQNLLYTVSVNALREAGNTKGVQLLEKMGPNQSQWSRKDFDKRNRLLVKAIKDVPNMITDLI